MLRELRRAGDVAQRRRAPLLCSVAAQAPSIPGLELRRRKLGSSDLLVSEACMGVFLTARMVPAMHTASLPHTSS